jgi:hypothetical protein
VRDLSEGCEPEEKEIIEQQQMAGVPDDKARVNGIGNGQTTGTKRQLEIVKRFTPEPFFSFYPALFCRPVVAEGIITLQTGSSAIIVANNICRKKVAIPGNTAAGACSICHAGQ